MACRSSPSSFHVFMCRGAGLTALLLNLGLGAGTSFCSDPEDPWCTDDDGPIPDVTLLQSLHRERTILGKASATATRLPNILIIFPDDMYIQDMAAGGWKDLAPQQPGGGYENWSAAAELFANYTENMNRIAEEGATFGSAYTASPFCSPSRWALLMGRYPSRNSWAELTTRTRYGRGVPTEVMDPIPMSDSEAKHNLPSMLQAYGYKTGMVGKWGLNSEGENYSTPYGDLKASVKRKGFECVEGLYIQNLNLDPDYKNFSFSHNMEWIVTEALTFMDLAIDEERPFFLYFAPMDPHLPPTVQDALQFDELETPAGRLEIAPDATLFCSKCGLANKATVLQRAETPWSNTGDMPYLRHSVVAAIFWLDSAIGSLYHFLRERGQLENTYIILTTDHNEAKGTLYEQGIRIPQFVRGPGIQRGIIITEPVSLLDIVPTVLDWVGAKVPEAPPAPPLDGYSWAHLAWGNVTSLPLRPIIAEISFDRAIVYKDRIKYITQGAGIFQNNYTDNLGFSMSKFFPHWMEEQQLYYFRASGEQTNLLGAQYLAYRVDESELEIQEAIAGLDAHQRMTLNAPVD